MKETTQIKLEAQGWRVGSVAEFLALTPEEVALVETKVALTWSRAPSERPKYMSKKIGRGPTRFVLCIDSGEHPASLEPRKLYEVLHDEDAEGHGQLRVIDESGDDFLYPREYFQAVDLSPALNRLVRGNGGRSGRLPRTVRRAATIRPTPDL